MPNGGVAPVSGVSWQSLNSTVATVDQTGKATVTGTSGSANIVATISGYDPAYGSIEIAHATPQTVQLSSSVVKSASSTSAVLVRNAQTQALLPGNIVVSGSAGALFGQITGVQIDATSVTLSLQQTTIPAAFPDYSYTWNGPPVQLTVQSAPGGRYIVTNKRRQILSQGPLEFHCSPLVSMKEIPSFTYPVSVRPIFQVDIARRFLQIGAEMSGSVSYSGGRYAVEATKPVACAASIDIVSNVQFAVPGTLLTAAPFITPSIGIELATDGSVTVTGPTASENFDVIAGFQYQSGRWSLLPSPGAPSATTGALPQFILDGHLGASASPYFKTEVGFNVCVLVCITKPFNNAIVSTKLVSGKIFGVYDISFVGPTNELDSGYRGPVFSNSAQAEAGLDVEFNFKLLDPLTKYINIDQLTILDKPLFQWSTTPVTSPSISVGAGATSVTAGDSVTLTATASGYTASGVRFVGFRNGNAVGTVLASSTLSGGSGSTKWTPSSAASYTIVALLDNVVGPSTASKNSIAINVAAAPPPRTPPPTTPPPTTPPPTTPPPVTPPPATLPPTTPPPVTPPPTTPPPNTPPPVTPPPTTPPPTTPPPTTKSATVANTGGTGLHIRSSPGINSSVLTTMPDGTQTTILGGPSIVNGYTWWNVRATVNGTQYTGWSGIGEWLSPPPSVGSVVTVSYTSGSGLNLHSSTSRSSTVVKALPEGTQMNVIGGPVSSEGYVWWNLRGVVGGTQYTGWSPTGPWLAPNPRY